VGGVLEPDGGAVVGGLADPDPGVDSLPDEPEELELAPDDPLEEAGDAELDDWATVADVVEPLWPVVAGLAFAAVVLVERLAVAERFGEAGEA